MNYFLIIINLLFIINIFSVNKQTLDHQLIYNINTLEFKKYIYTDLDSITSFDLDSINGFISSIYTDKENRIRKSITKINYPDYKGFAVHYFNINGALVYLIIKEYSTLNPSVVGTIFKNDSIIITDIQYNDDYDHCIGLATDSLFYGGRLASINNLVDLRSFIENLETRQIQCNKLVTFRPPIKGDQIILNKRIIDLKKRPFVSSEGVEGGLGTLFFKGFFNREVNSNWVSIYIDQHEYYISPQFIEPIEVTLK